MLSWMSAVDQRDGTRFSFEHCREPLEIGEVLLEGRVLRRRDATWRWQRYVAELVASEKRFMLLKGRQIGATWVVLGIDVAEAINMPGTSSLLFRQREDEAVDNVRRWWTLYKSLPHWLTGDIKVLKPDLGRTALPGREGIMLQFPNGDISEVVPMSSAASSGHGRSVRRITVDEGAYVEKLEQIMAAIDPAAANAKLGIISTANGRSNPETGDGNEYHRRWVDEGSNVTKLFLPYDIHPERDEAWYATEPQVQSLKVYQRNAQFPRNEHEAFALSSRVFFDADDMDWYSKNGVREPLYRCNLVQKSDRSKLARVGDAAFHKHGDGMIRIFREPVEGHGYAIGADVATGHGRDYSAAYVIDLSNGELAAEFHARLDEDLYAAQLHYLGRWYGRVSGGGNPADPDATGFAKLAVETGGGFGNAVIAPLRDRTAGRPAYANLYRHLLDNRPDVPTAKPYGFPMNTGTRTKAINGLDAAIRERALPWVTAGLLHEMGDFVHHDSGTSPRAQDGTNDDRVMAATITLEMYRLYGHHPNKRKRRRPARPKPLYPWQREKV